MHWLQSRKSANLIVASSYIAIVHTARGGGQVSNCKSTRKKTSISQAHSKEFTLNRSLKIFYTNRL
jgi:hypothetical protein